MKVVTADAIGILLSGKLHHGCLYDSKAGTCRVMRATPNTEIEVDALLYDEANHWQMGLREVNRDEYKYLAFPFLKVKS